MKSFVVNGIELKYQVSGTGIPFVFLHGMGGSVNQIASVYEPLNGIRLISMNQQGHEDSGADWEHLDFNRLGDDVIALLTHLGIEKACFAGISMGAAVSLNVAVRYPDRVSKLLLIRNAWTDKPMSDRVQKAYEDLGECLRDGGADTFYKTEGWQIVREPSAYTRNAFLIPFQNPSEHRNWKKYLILPKKVPVQSPDELKSLSMPVIILANRNDLCHPFEYGTYLHSAIPDSEFLEIPDKDRDSVGHREMINQVIRSRILTG